MDNAELSPSRLSERIDQLDAHVQALSQRLDGFADVLRRLESMTSQLYARNTRGER